MRWHKGRGGPRGPGPGRAHLGRVSLHTCVYIFQAEEPDPVKLTPGVIASRSPEVRRQRLL